MYDKAELARVLADLKHSRAMLDLQIHRLETMLIVDPPDLKGDVLLTEIVNQTPSAKIEIEPVKQEPLTMTDEWVKVLDLLNNSSEHIFVTGDAGTGKSTLLSHFINNTWKSVAVVAPTGVAALRVGAETIHKFFKFRIDDLAGEELPRLKSTDREKYRNLDILIIDEISMVRADLMDRIDKFLRKNGRYNDQPFGGVRIVMFGDLFQLPPVAKEKDEKKYLEHRYGTECPYFFHAECWRDTPPKICELTTIFRQKDEQFTAALNAIRRGIVTPEQMSLINGRVRSMFKPPDGELWLTLTTTNDSADTANRRMLSSLPGEAQRFEASVVDDFDLRNAPTDEILQLKPDAVVMFIRNDPDGHWVNGTLGKVIKTTPLEVETNGVHHRVDPVEWENITYEFDPEKKKLSRSVKGKFVQMPLKLAAAITIHKSQGTTLDRAIIDMGFGSFAAGQTYVALSRLRSLDGMILRKAITQDDLIVSTEVQAFMAGKEIARPKAQATLF